MCKCCVFMWMQKLLYVHRTNGIECVYVCIFEWMCVNVCECVWMFVNLFECVPIFVNVCEWCNGAFYRSPKVSYTIEV